MDSLPGELLAGFHHLRDPFTFFHDQGAVKRHTAQAVQLPTGPANLEFVDAAFLAEAEVHARIVSGQVAFPGPHAGVLNEIAGSELQARTDAVPVAPGSDGSDGYPVPRTGGVLKKRGQRFHVRVDDVNVSVIVEIRISGAARGKQREVRQPGLAAYFGEDPRRRLTEHQGPLDILLHHAMRLFRFWIHMPIGGEQVRPSIIVKIRKKRTPAEKRMRRRSNAGFAGYIEEQPLACVVVEREVILRKSSDEQVHGSIV